MPKAQPQTKTEFFENIIADKNVPAAQVQIFFRQAYGENEGAGEKLRLLNLLKAHRPELHAKAVKNIVRG